MTQLLLVDDDSATRDAVKRTLRQDFEILEAGSAEEALVVLSKNHEVAVIVADEKMPGQSGTKLLEEVRKIYPRIVRVILSGHIRLEQMMIAINKAEIHRFILKPWDNEALRIHMHEAVLQHRDLDEITRLQKLAVTDGVTGLTNHRYFQEHLRLEIERSSRHGRSFSLMMIDVDDFKKFNDEFGHPEGDRALAKIAALLNRLTRAADSVSRYGGDEFAIILPETEKKAALEVAERIRTQLGTVSIGLASYPADAMTAAPLVKAADGALYKAKSQGKNKVEVYSP